MEKSNVEIIATIRQEIERRITDNTFGAKLELIDILAYLDSLSVDAPDFPTTDKEMEKFLANTPPVEVPVKYKNPDWLFKRPMKDAPEVFDFEKELEAYHQGYWPKTDNGDESLTYSPNAIRRLVAHFFELGLNEKPDAPEGLDEAAVDGADTLLAKPKDYALAAKADYWNGAHDGFKAGAEWAFGQGVTVNEMITKIREDCYLDIDGDQEQMLSVFDNEEEVIVQIRKK